MLRLGGGAQRGSASLCCISIKESFHVCFRYCQQQHLSVPQSCLHPVQFPNFQKEFQQLGQDLQSGNLSQAQADFQALESPVQPVPSTNTQSSTNSLSSAMSQLSQDLQSGNLSAAQQDYATVQQDLQQQFSGAVSGHHHHHHHASSSQESASQNPLNQLFSQLGQALQSGNLSAAQSAYASLQQEFQQLGASSPSSTSSCSSSSTTSLNLSA
jgi:outer membrane protein assembly factor BamD (BamD/ComL family)